MRRYSVSIDGMHCVACAEAVRKAIEGTKGVRKVQVNFATGHAIVEVDDEFDFRSLADAIERVGYRLTTTSVEFALNKPLDEKAVEALKATSGVLMVEHVGAHVFIHYIGSVVSRHELTGKLQALGYEVEQVERLMEKPFDEVSAAPLRALVGLAISFTIMAVLMSPLANSLWAQLLTFILATFVIVWVGMPFFRRGINAALHRTATMDTLVSIGALSSYGYSAFELVAMNLGLHAHGHLYFDSASFILSAISLGKWLEGRARSIATVSLHQLVSMLPSTATVLRDGSEVKLPLETVKAGDIVVVRVGERVPVDGIVLRGVGSVDESLLTGESEPAIKRENDEVLGGSFCVDGFMQVEALRVGESTFIAQMARLMEEAQSTKPRMQRLADKLAAIFVPAVLALSLFTLILWLVIVGDLARAIIAAVSVTIIACPCAMGLATPTAIAVLLGRLAQLGIFIRNAEAIERASEVTTAVLDKTGTVTKGQMQVVSVWSPTVSEDELLRIAASVERGTHHPIAQALMRAASERNLALLEPTNVHTEVGVGVTAMFAGEAMCLGQGNIVVFIGSIDASSVPVDAPIKDWLENGWSVIGVWANSDLLGCIALTDELRQDAIEAVHELKAMGISVILATGDKPEVAFRVASKLDCDVLPLATPQRKAELVRQLQAKGECVLMVGDGVNDAIALSQADVGVAVASGAELLAQAADALLVSEHLTTLVDFVLLAKNCKRIMLQNLFWAFAYNMAALPIAAFGKLNPMIAAVAMALSSITVVGNALRMRTMKV
ncbi:MAG: heavy metal translocating P-type ATPase [Armatimonadetes bacterium]|nr:heavy metal translocating P-type ATPase [Armatimonadota bacterium]